MSQPVRLGDFIGNDLEENFMEFDLTEIHKVSENLQNIEPIDLAHAEVLQQQALRGADIIISYLGKLTKTVGYLEARVNSVRNKASLDYKSPDGGKTTTDMKIWAGQASSEVEEIQTKLAKAKASKMVLEKKYDILIRTHHYYKDITAGLRKTILGYTQTNKVPEGYE